MAEKHYWIPCSGCKKPQFQGLSEGNLVPTSATCIACDPSGASVTYRAAGKHAPAPLAPCCKVAAAVDDEADHEPQLPEA